MNGNLVGSFNIPTRKTNPGVWGVNEAANYMKQDMWPTVQDPNIANVWFLVHGNAVLNTSQPLVTVSNLTNPSVHYFANSSGASSDTAVNPSPFFSGNSFKSFGANGAIVTFSSATIALQDFTLEGFFQIAGFSANQQLMDGRPPSTNGNYPLVQVTSSKTFAVVVNSLTKITSGAIGVITTPYHVAYVRSGGNLGVLYVNGTSVGSWVDSTSYAAQSQYIVSGAAFPGASGLLSNGWYDEFRLTVGTARYLSNFTAPTARFPDY